MAHVLKANDLNLLYEISLDISPSAHTVSVPQATIMEDALIL
jgi:hypothetical protein